MSTSSQPATEFPTRLRFSEFFEGIVKGRGVFVDPWGRVRSNISVTTNGFRRNGTFILDEEFKYETGEVERRSWVLKDLSPDVFVAQCADCVGHITGHNAVDRVRMAYTFKLRLKNWTFHVTFDDQVFPIDRNRVFNRATMKKFGITLGHILLLSERQSPQP
jgi:hypothetical protein